MNPKKIFITSAFFLSFAMNIWAMNQEQKTRKRQSVVVACFVLGSDFTLEAKDAILGECLKCLESPGNTILIFSRPLLKAMAKFYPQKTAAILKNAAIVAKKIDVGGTWYVAVPVFFALRSTTIGRYSLDTSLGLSFSRHKTCCLSEEIKRLDYEWEKDLDSYSFSRVIKQLLEPNSLASLSFHEIISFMETNISTKCFVLGTCFASPSFLQRLCLNPKFPLITLSLAETELGLCREQQLTNICSLLNEFPTVPSADLARVLSKHGNLQTLSVLKLKACLVPVLYRFMEPCTLLAARDYICEIGSATTTAHKTIHLRAEPFQTIALLVAPKITSSLVIHEHDRGQQDGILPLFMPACNAYLITIKRMFFSSNQTLESVIESLGGMLEHGLNRVIRIDEVFIGKQNFQLLLGLIHSKTEPWKKQVFFKDHATSSEKQLNSNNWLSWVVTSQGITPSSENFSRQQAEQKMKELCKPDPTYKPVYATNDLIEKVAHQNQISFH